MPKILLSLTDEMDEALRSYCFERRITKSGCIRELLSIHVMHKVFTASAGQSEQRKKLPVRVNVVATKTVPAPEYEGRPMIRSGSR